MKTLSNRRTFPIVIEKDENGFFVATNTSLSGCFSQGKTIEEALSNVQEATELYLEKMPENGEGSLGSQISVHLITA